MYQVAWICPRVPENFNGDGPGDQNISREENCSETSRSQYAQDFVGAVQEVRLWVVNGSHSSRNVELTEDLRTLIVCLLNTPATNYLPAIGPWLHRPVPSLRIRCSDRRVIGPTRLRIEDPGAIKP
jgi:hypothetical protein